MRPNAFTLLTLIAASVGVLHSSTMQPTTPPFHFTLAPSAERVKGSEVWDATVQPDSTARDSLPAVLQLSLASPARSAPVGARIQATLRRGGKGDTRFLWAPLLETFEPPSFRQRGSGALMPVELSPADSVDLSLTVRERTADEPWTAVAELQNGGRFLIAIDSAAGWGEFRSVGAEYHMQVFKALVGLISRNP